MVETQYPLLSTPLFGISHSLEFLSPPPAVTVVRYYVSLPMPSLTPLCILSFIGSTLLSSTPLIPAWLLCFSNASHSSTAQNLSCRLNVIQTTVKRVPGGGCLADCGSFRDQFAPALLSFYWHLFALVLCLKFSWMCTMTCFSSITWYKFWVFLKHTLENNWHHFRPHFWNKKEFTESSQWQFPFTMIQVLGQKIAE